MLGPDIAGEGSLKVSLSIVPRSLKLQTIPTGTNCIKELSRNEICVMVTMNKS